MKPEKFYVFIIDVRGNSPFPIDMARRDSAVPAREEDANTIARSIEGGGVGVPPYTVRLRVFSCNADYYSAVTFGRWKSFRWQVLGQVPAVNSPDGEYV